MKNIVIIFLFTCSLSAYSQEVVELGVKFTVKDSLVIIENLDRKFKHISIIERDKTEMGGIELALNYDIEGDVVQDHKLYTKNGDVVVEIISDIQKKKFVISRVKERKY